MKKSIITALPTLTFVFSSFVLSTYIHAAEEHHHNHQHEESVEHKKHHTDDAHEEHEEHENHIDHKKSATEDHHDEDQHDHSEHDHGDHDEYEHNEHGHGDHDEDEHGHDEENSSRINSEMARQVGVVTATAGSQELHQVITVYGNLVSGPEQLSHVRARFEGLVKSVDVTIGDTVKTGDVLAEIESNESLRIYKIRSPISGRVVQRHANSGEVTRDQVLFSIANFDTVWAELRIYPTQQTSVSEGQSVHISTANERIESKVKHVVPSMDAPYQLARVKLDNSKYALSPGLMVEAELEVGRFYVPLAVTKDAVQSMGGRQGVFVKHGDEYTFTPLILGRKDDHFYEVIDGLEISSEYVSQNSYLIKADIEKSQAEHEH